MPIIGYARTSTAKQEAGLEEQVRVLSAQRCDEIFEEQVSQET
jgi:predicted site-specific integrase-resolvase